MDKTHPMTDDQRKEGIVIKPGINGVGKATEQRIDRCQKCGKIILRWEHGGVIGSPNPHRCEKTYEELLDENQALFESRKEWQDGFHQLKNDFDAQAKEIERLDRVHMDCIKIASKYEEQAALYREALEWYADEATYDIEHLNKHGYIIIDRDRGQRARQAIGGNP